MKLIHTGASPSALTMVRVLLCGLCLLKVAIDPIQRLALLPFSIFTPPFPLNLFPAEIAEGLVTSPGALLALRIFTALFALLVMCGIKVPWTGIAACLLFTTYQALVGSYGHINHAEVPLILGLYAFVGHAWIAKIPEYRPKQAEHTLITITFLFCLTYTLIAARRFAQGGLDIFLQPVMEGWSVEMASRVSYFNLGWGRYAAESALFCLFLRVGFVLGTIAELLAPFALVSRRFRQGFVAVMVPMHLMILLVMNIGFFENIAMYVLFIDMGMRKRETPCLVLFDGVCNFCNGFINFLMRRNPQGTLYFVASQSEAGRKVMEHYGISEEEVGKTVFAIEGNRKFSRSTAVLGIMAHLEAPWRFLSHLAIIPKPVRDAVYNQVSARRYRIFGKADACRIPTPEERSRFLETSAQWEAYEGKQSALQNS